MPATWIKGSNLSHALQQAVLRAFVYRNTTDNRRERPFLFVKGGALHSCAIPPVTDATWLASHVFAVTKRGTLSKREKFCQACN